MEEDPWKSILGDDDDETGGKKKKGKGKEKVTNGRRKRLMSDDGSETEEDLPNGAKRKSPVKKVSYSSLRTSNQAHPLPLYRLRAYLLKMPNRRKSKLRLNEPTRLLSRSKKLQNDSKYEKRTCSKRRTSRSQQLS